MARIVGDDQRRFESRFTPEALSGCWLWEAAIDGYGYGRFWYRGEIIKAHRASWLLYVGPIPDGWWVLHRCDNPFCVNPAHLFVGDRTANMQDMAAKGRQVFQAQPEKIKRGEQSVKAKLTEDQARSVLARLAKGERGSSLAREFGVSKATISALKAGRNWAHLR